MSDHASDFKLCSFINDGQSVKVTWTILGLKTGVDKEKVKEQTLVDTLEWH